MTNFELLRSSIFNSEKNSKFIFPLNFHTKIFLPSSKIAIPHVSLSLFILELKQFSEHVKFNSVRQEENGNGLVYIIETTCNFSPVLLRMYFVPFFLSFILSFTFFWGKRNIIRLSFYRRHSLLNFYIKLFNSHVYRIYCISL